MYKPKVIPLSNEDREAKGWPSYVDHMIVSHANIYWESDDEKYHVSYRLAPYDADGNEIESFALWVQADGDDYMTSTVQEVIQSEEE